MGGVRNSCVRLDADVLGDVDERKEGEPPAKPGAETTVAYALNSNDALYAENYNSVKTHVNVTEVVNKTTHGHDFRGRWNLERQMLEGDAVYDEIEDRIAQQEPPMATLRLLCLQSLCGGGIKGQAKYDFLRREVLQTYGFELIGTLYQLEKAGLLSKAKEGTVATNLLLGGADGAGSFAQLRKALKLIVDDVDPHDPRDIAYVSSGRR
ncbi:hypothetical protein JL721_9221 [Aureococcus anophagefferens]|nr:hypothetical protein JL721_9221 [Aureococcus anophagefferens]